MSNTGLCERKLIMPAQPASRAMAPPDENKNH